jgi:hypothetical protein
VSLARALLFQTQPRQLRCAGLRLDRATSRRPATSLEHWPLPNARPTCSCRQQRSAGLRLDRATLPRTAPVTRLRARRIGLSLRQRSAGLRLDRATWLRTAPVTRLCARRISSGPMARRAMTGTHVRPATGAWAVSARRLGPPIETQCALVPAPTVGGAVRTASAARTLGNAQVAAQEHAPPSSS